MSMTTEKSTNSRRDFSLTNCYDSARLDKRRRITITGLVLICGVLSFLSSRHFGIACNQRVDLLSETSYTHLAGHCDSIPPISHSEFLSRQANLVKTLHALNASAYIAEPGANTQFFGNFSKVQWSLSERPLLLIITPVTTPSFDTEEIRSRITVLAPKFEATRAKLLPIPSLEGMINYIEWAEDADPYAKALSALPPQTRVLSGQKIYVDNGIRKFIVDGLHRASASEPSFNVFQRHLPANSKESFAWSQDDQRPSIDILSAPLEITQMRERKSAAELQILKCVNEATLLAIRDVHKKLVPGIQESYSRSMMSTALSAAGLKDGGCLTLFGENAALPHGSGTDRTLTASDFALFDCTASLHGYYSDVTRTVALSQTAPLSKKQLDLWYLVHVAQFRAIQAVVSNSTTGEVDAAARASFNDNGGDWARYFTHRLGHGIGLEVHEAPYLVGGSKDVIQVGHTFSNEPGLYIEGEFGIRLEDCFFVNADGYGSFLTDGVGGRSMTPWKP